MTLGDVVAIGSLLGTLVTAVATFFLWRVTKLLAVETQRMAKAAAQPHVVATLEANRWSMRHFDLHVTNTGNAAAYDIEVEFSPPLQNGEARAGGIGIPFQRVSVLRSGQGVSSYLSDYTRVKGQVYSVRITWRASAGSTKEENSYTLDMTDKEGVSDLGGDPVVKIAEHLKKIEENWKYIASGSRRMKVDAFGTADRLHEERVAARQRRNWRAKAAAQTAPAPTAPMQSPESELPPPPTAPSSTPPTE